MSRIYHSSIPACPTLFTPLQPHVRELLRIGVRSWVGWMRDNIISLQQMVREHDAAVVVAGASLSYERPMLFHDADTITTETSSSLLKSGVLIKGTTVFSAADSPFAQFEILFRPVLIADHLSAAARPGKLPAELCKRFEEDEQEPATPDRAVRRQVAELQSTGTLLGTHEHAFVHHRHGMDFADQWAFMEAAAYVGASRETMATTQAGVDERVLAGLTKPIRDYRIELTKPYFLLDRGTVQTSAYAYNGELHFLHRLVASGSADVHATVLEAFELG